MKRKLVFEITLPLKTVAGLNAREHHMARARRARSERRAAYVMVKAVQLPCIVTITRISPGTLDGDNLQGSAKHVRDGIADRLGVNDNDPRVTWRYAQEKCARREFGVRVRIESCATAGNGVSATSSQRYAPCSSADSTGAGS